MNTLKFSISINAPREKVWHTMLDLDTYKEWTKAFDPNSNYRGDWSEGSKMLFVGPSEDGKESGMVSRVKTNKPLEYLSIQHLGLLNNDVEELWEEEKTGFENYTFVEKDGATELLIELVNLPEEYNDMMNESWPKALELLKGLSETS